ncbi:hypothetical protein SAMN05660337_0717 [Maridesulfovibrio ferrireducens]|uniref:Uncharacterized protein n=1 Tax=Maridesulfovibrio ferrireducens TaxID=246191 RepID=A0A1G9CLM7_9BACT|nr:hypothetical protein [Maridesulfovibrio ferrireducens]SDK52354.1 hypothetical protein SAMN05660337_0717 [Maridesulfovibrio ferrireducens]
MKKITAIFTVLLMLAASSAFAAITVEAPAGLVNASKYFTGFTFNATAKIAVSNQTMMVYNSTTDGFYSNGTQTSVNQFSIASDGHNDLYGNCTFSVYNGTDWVTKWTNGSVPTDNLGAGGTGAGTFSWAANQVYGNIQGVLAMGPQGNGTNATTYFTYTSGQSFMVGIANATINATGMQVAQSSRSNGTQMAMLYNNGSIDGSVWDNTWDYYAFGVDADTAQPGFIAGQVKLGSAGVANNVQAKLTAVEGGARSFLTSWTNYNATTYSNKNLISIQRADSQTLLTNGTVNADRNLITGYILDDDASGINQQGDRLFVVMIKAGSTLSTNDLTNRAFKLVYAGTSNTVDYVGNATMGMMAFSADANLKLDGDITRMNPTPTGANSLNLRTVDMSGYTVALADTTQFGPTQSNMTIYNAGGVAVGSFYGKQSADKTMTVGIYESLGTQETGYSLAFLMPNPAVTAVVGYAAAGYQSNASVTALVTPAVANTTAYSQVALRAQWSGLPSNFTPLTDVKNVKGNLPATSKAGSAFTFQMKFTGIGDKINNLKLYKLFPTAAATVRGFSYANSATPSVDGAWWISNAVADGYLNKESVLAPNVEYYLNYVVKDNGSFDANGTAYGINDPIVLGSVPTSSSSSSSGCVFNPAAGFGLEWLLLMLAPMVAIVRSRFKK